MVSKQEQLDFGIAEVQKLNDDSHSVYGHDNPQYVLACLRALGPNYMMSERGPYGSFNSFGKFEIRFNPMYLDKAIKDMKEEFNLKKDDSKYYGCNFDYIIKHLRGEAETSYKICKALVSHLESQSKDEEEAIKKRIEFEEDIRARFRNYRY